MISNTAKMLTMMIECITRSCSACRQVLSGDSGVRLFGYSLAGNMDLDLNDYPDVAIGSLSDSVFIYR